VSTAVPIPTLDPALLASPTPGLVLTATLPATAVLTPTLTVPLPTFTIPAATATLLLTVTSTALSTSTPTALPTATPLPPPRTRSNIPAGAFPESHVAWNLITDDNYLFRFQVNDTNQGNFDGAGIVSVRFIISDQNGNVIYQRTEVEVAYCVFSGGNPLCNPWVLENGRYRWGSGGPELVSGDYFASIYVIPQFIDPNENATTDPDGNLAWGWFFDFHVDGP